MQGLLGRLIKEYKLGVTIDKIDKNNIAKAIKAPMEIVSSFYAQSRQLSHFQLCYK